jgi:hypothetical protein
MPHIPRALMNTLLLPFAVISLTVGCSGMSALNDGLYQEGDTGETGDTGPVTNTYWWTEYSTEETGTTESTSETTQTFSTTTETTSTETTTSSTTETTETTETTGTTTTSPSSFDGTYTGSFDLTYNNILLGIDTCSGNGTMTLSDAATPKVSSTLECNWPIFSALKLIFSDPTATATGNFLSDGSASGNMNVSDGADLNISMSWSANIVGNQINGTFNGSDIFDSYGGTFSLSR